MSTKAWVTHQATSAVCPKCGKPGTPGTVRPMTSNASQARWACAYMFGISSTRCGSPATIGRPGDVRSAEIAQLLLPPSCSAPLCSCVVAAAFARASLLLRRGVEQRGNAGLEVGKRRREPLALHAWRHAQQIAAAI